MKTLIRITIMCLGISCLHLQAQDPAPAPAPAPALAPAESPQVADDKRSETFFFANRKFASRHHWYWGAGAVVSDIPVVKSRFSVPFSQILYEYNVTDPSSKTRFAMGGGLYGLMAILPVPCFQPSFYWGSEDNDVMARFSAGAFSDIVVGGHSGVLFSGGVVIKNRIDISLVCVPFGTQPVRPYPEILGRTQEQFYDTSAVAYKKDPNGKNLIAYSPKKYHPDDTDRYNADVAGTDLRYYSEYDMDYGNASWSGERKANPEDFDYVKGREYISFPYFGLMVTFRH